jgi:phage/plasmid-like protein (TIGR03299 family)
MFDRVLEIEPDHEGARTHREDCLRRKKSPVRAAADVTEKYLLLTNRHDGLGAVQVFFTPIRVVCQNTLNIALKGEGTKASLRHTTTIGMKVEEVRKQLGIIHASFGMFEEAARRLATVQLTSEAFNNYIKKSGVIPDDEEKLGTRAAAVRDELTRLFEYGIGADLPGSKGTVWGAFNAVAEYVDYFKPARGQGKSDREDSRAKSILFGSGLSLKQTAWDAALEIAR